MTPTDLSPAGCDAGKAALRLNSGHEKTLPFEGQGWYSVRATGKPATAPVALRNPPKPIFEVSRYETFR